MNTHADQWQKLNDSGSIVAKLATIHQVMQKHLPFISRIAVAMYDAQTDYLSTFAYSSAETSPLTHYQAKLADCFALHEIAKTGQPRVINDLAIYADSEHVHAQIIYHSGYRASYTLPLFWDGHLLGFIFFNAHEHNVFDEKVLNELDVIAHMITLMLYNEKSHINTLLATLKSAIEMTHSRDPETGCHLERMSRYARLIAQNLAEKYHLSDQYIEHVFLFAPLHDLGKLAIPDRILLKAGALTEEEFSIMRTHSQEGQRLIDKLLANYGLHGITHVDMLRNIALHHHEAIDGSGYPMGLLGNAIPLEARIVTVADVFDALTSKRPYKEAWTNEAAFAHLRKLADIKLDAECVDALLQNPEKIIEIQQAFKENSFG